MPDRVRLDVDQAVTDAGMRPLGDAEYDLYREEAEEVAFTAAGPDDYFELVAKVQSFRSVYGRKSRTRADAPDLEDEDDSARTEAAQPSSELASEEWATYWQREQQRQVVPFESARQSARAALGLEEAIPVDMILGCLLERAQPLARVHDPRPDELFDRSWAEAVQYAREELGLPPWPAHRTWSDQLDGDDTQQDEADDESFLFGLRIPLTTTDRVASHPYPPSSKRRVYEGRVLFPDGNERLGPLWELAHDVTGTLRCREAQAVAWALSDELPPAPLLNVTSRVARPSTGVKSWRYTIEVGSHLVPPEEVAELYRRTRDHDTWSGNAPHSRTKRASVWTPELLHFVKANAPRGPKPWKSLLESFVQRYPQKRKHYHSPQAMKQAHREAVARQQRMDTP